MRPLCRRPSILCQATPGDLRTRAVATDRPLASSSRSSAPPPRSPPVPPRGASPSSRTASPPSPPPSRSPASSESLRNRLNRSINQCESLDELFSLYQKFGSKFEQQNTANAIYAFAKMARGICGGGIGVGGDGEGLGGGGVRGGMQANVRQAVDEAEFFDETSEVIADRRDASASSSSASSSLASSSLSLDSIAVRKSLIARLDGSSQTLCLSLLDRARTLLPAMSPMDYSLVVWSLGCLALLDAPLVDAILARAVSQLGRLKPQDVSHLVLSCARLGVRASQHLDALGDVAAGQLGRFKPQEISSLIWGFAKLGFHPGDLLTSRLSHEVTQRVHQFKTMELCIILWSFAVLGVRDTGLVDLFMREVTAPERLYSMRPQCIANSMWSYGKFYQTMHNSMNGGGGGGNNTSDKGLVLGGGSGGGGDVEMEEAEEEEEQAATRNVHSPSSRPSLHHHALGGISSHGVMKRDEFVQRLVKQSHAMLPQFKPQELSVLVYACAAADHLDETLFDAVAEEAIGRLVTFKAQELVLLVWAFGKVKYSHEQLLNAVATEAARRMRDWSRFPFKPMGLANLLKGFARLEHRPATLLPLAYAQAARTVHSYQPTEMSNLLFAVTRFGDAPLDLVEKVVNEVAQRKADGQVFSSTYVRSIVQSCEAMGGRAKETADVLLPFLEDGE